MGYPGSFEMLCEEMKNKKAKSISKYKIRQGGLIFTFAGTFCSSCEISKVIETARIFYKSGQRHPNFIVVGDGDNGAKLRKKGYLITPMVIMDGA